MNVLIVRPDGIGDVILSLPVASQLKQLVPGVKTGFLTSPVVAPVLERHPDVDYVRTIRWTDPLRELRAVFSDGVDVTIFLKPFRRLMWAAFLARVPVRVATGYRWYSLLANRRVYEHRSDFSKHESKYNVGLLTGLGLRPGEPIRPALCVTGPERDEAEIRWGKLPLPRVVVHPGGGQARRWRPEHYRELTFALARQGYGVTLTGNQAEKIQFAQEALTPALLPIGLNNLMGQLSVRELMAMIATAQVVVSGSTGPAHLAAAVGVPTVSLYDPRRNNLPTRWKPLGTGVLLRPDVPTCEKCIHEACPYWDCLDRIDVNRVAMIVDSVVEDAKPIQILHV